MCGRGARGWGKEKGVEVGWAAVTSIYVQDGGVVVVTMWGAYVLKTGVIIIRVTMQVFNRLTRVHFQMLDPFQHYFAIAICRDICMYSVFRCTQFGMQELAACTRCVALLLLCPWLWSGNVTTPKFDVYSQHLQYIIDATTSQAQHTDISPCSFFTVLFLFTKPLRTA